MRIRTAVLLAAPLLAAACVSANVTYLGPRQGFAPVAEDEVRVFAETDTVPAECQRFAVITTAGDVHFTSESQATEAARRRAGKIGANAIQLLGSRNPRVSTQIAAVLSSSVQADRRGQMLAFRCEQPRAGLFHAIREFLGLGD